MKKHRSNVATQTGANASIMGGWLYFEDVRQAQIGTEEFASLMADESLRAVRMESLENGWEVKAWIDWDTSVIESINTHFTLRRETVRGKQFWYAYRRALGKLHKRYVGKSEDITEAKLLEIAQKLPTA